MGFDWLPVKNYKRHYVCLKCQKGFKRASKEDMEHQVDDDFSNLMNVYYETTSPIDIINYINATHEKIKVPCPQCTNAMKLVHYNFEVPSKRDTKTWNYLRETFETQLYYDMYIYWHQIQLKKIVPTSSASELLKKNLEKLQKKSSSIKKS